MNPTAEVLAWEPRDPAALPRRTERATPRFRSTVASPGPLPLDRKSRPHGHQEV
jgi:hypothetical protein